MKYTTIISDKSKKIEINPDGVKINLYSKDKKKKEVLKEGKGIEKVNINKKDINKDEKRIQPNRKEEKKAKVS